MESSTGSAADKTTGQKWGCGPKDTVIVIPPGEVSLIVAGAALAGLFLLVAGILIGTRMSD